MPWSFESEEYCEAVRLLIRARKKHYREIYDFFKHDTLEKASVVNLITDRCFLLLKI